MMTNTQQPTFNVQSSILGGRRWAFISASLMLLQFSSPLLLLADTHYVDINCATPVSPYTNWSTAATVIQNAIDVTSAGDTVMVSDGVYTNGGRAVYGIMTNRIVITTAITVKSVNGPVFTRIVGRSPLGDSAVRCVYIGAGALLTGFTLTNGATRLSGDYDKERSGGGVWCNSGVLSNCVLSGNSASYSGGGSYGGTLNNCTLSGNSVSYWDGRGGGSYGGTLKCCTLSGNSAPYGGGSASNTLNNCTLTGNSAAGYGRGAGGGSYFCTLNNCIVTNNSAYYDGGGSYDGILNNCTLTRNSACGEGGGAYVGTLNNCTLTGNSASYGGGSYYGTRNNCIIWYNSAPCGPNYVMGTMKYCCTTPMPSGVGNISDDPLLASTSHLSAGSPCIGKGSGASTRGVDIDGEPWSTPPSMGCDEYRLGAVTGDLIVAIEAGYAQVAVGFQIPFTSLIEGRTTGSQWDFGDGTLANNLPYISHAWSSTGTYTVMLTAFNESYPAGISATVSVQVVEQPVHYVSLSSQSPMPPYLSWATAATNIQDAVDAASFPGALVLVADGVYKSGGVAVYELMTNRVAITKPVRVQSLNGPERTVIRGHPVPRTTNGDGAVRCVYLADGAVLSGFTLTNGATLTYSYPGSDVGQSGGGVWCESINAIVTNCAILGNSASDHGGGAYRGTLKDCTLVGNSAVSAGGNGDANCGGGAYNAVLSQCNLVGNMGYCGGAAYKSTLSQCSIVDNLAPQAGGGAGYCALNSCVLTGNSAKYGGGVSICNLKNCTLTGNSASEFNGGTYCSTLNNCIVWYNSAPSYPNFDDDFDTLINCCSTPLPYGVGNISVEPLLASASNLSAVSPCIGKGNSAYATGSDIDGEPWSSPPSIGCDEYRVGTVTGDLTVAIEASYTQVGVGFQVKFIALIGGRTTSSQWNFGDGITASNLPYIAHSWSSTGTYAVVLTAFNESHPSGISAMVTVHVVAQPVHYVSLSSQTPMSPYLSWATAATNIQDAVDAAHVSGALVLVADGVYDTGGVAVYGLMTNRVAITKPLKVQSVNGPGATWIVGRGAGGGATNGNGAVRCAYVGSDAMLSGFTLTNGHTRGSGSYDGERDGGGAWCEVSGAISNCALSGNSASFYGGGVYHGTLNNCTLMGNSAAYAGGAYNATLNVCLLVGNSAALSYGTAGGAYYSKLNSCTVVGNTAGDSGGGTENSTLNNCIVWYNSATYDSNYGDWSTLSYCSSTPKPYGVGNIIGAPQFVDTNAANYRLKSTSPCINAGLNQAWIFEATDLDGKPRIRNGVVDMGAYEFAFEADLKSLLQGAYNTNTHVMATSLSTNVPLTSPYASNLRKVAAIPSNVLDWALVEVQDTNGISLASTSAFLDAQGKVRDVTGGTNISVEVSAGNYYLVLKHRNHLAAMSALPVAFTNTVVSYDFTTGPDKYFGGTNACVKLEPGVWGLIGGDADGDGRITPVDREIVRRQRGMTSYMQGDLNLDGKVDGGDE